MTKRWSGETLVSVMVHLGTGVTLRGGYVKPRRRRSDLLGRVCVHMCVYVCMCAGVGVCVKEHV